MLTRRCILERLYKQLQLLCCGHTENHQDVFLIWHSAEYLLLLFMKKCNGNFFACFSSSVTSAEFSLHLPKIIHILSRTLIQGNIRQVANLMSVCLHVFYGKSDFHVICSTDYRYQYCFCQIVSLLYNESFHSGQYISLIQSNCCIDFEQTYCQINEQNIWQMDKLSLF